MAKVFQIVNGMCHWCTPFNSVDETVGKFPTDCIFVEAPDYVHESWGYQETDKDGNVLPYEERFIKPTAPEGWLYDDETGTFYPEEEASARLERAQKNKQEQNKMLFADWLSNNPLTYTDGKTYGVTMEDQTEIQLNLNQYQIQIEAGVENPVLEWHAKHEACTSWTYEELSALSIAISTYVYPWFQKMNDYKAAIFASETIEELDAIELIYGEDKEAVEEENDVAAEATEE